MDIRHMNDYDIAVINNGCGPANVLDFLPKKLVKALKPYMNQIFAECCKGHDIDFRIGGSKEDFLKANAKFYRCMKRVIKKEAHWYSRWWFYYKAWQYFNLVAEFGWDSFNSQEPMDLEDLPSYQIAKDPKITQRCVRQDGRWWLRSELGFKK